MGKVIRVRSHVRKGKKVTPHVRIIKAKAPAKKFVRTPLNKHNTPETEEEYQKRIASNATRKPVLSKDKSPKTFMGKTPEQIAALRDKAISKASKIKKEKLKREVSLARRTKEKKQAHSDHVKNMNALAKQKQKILSKPKSASGVSGSITNRTRKSVLTPTKVKKLKKYGLRVTDRLKQTASTYNNARRYTDNALRVGL